MSVKLRRAQSPSICIPPGAELRSPQPPRSISHQKFIRAAVKDHLPHGYCFLFLPPCEKCVVDGEKGKERVKMSSQTSICDLS